jgi:hypothetical protein
MKLIIILFLISISFSNVSSAVNPTDLLMGVEIESNTCKLTVGTQERTGFIIKGLSCSMLWHLEDDTIDQALKLQRKLKDYNRNTECRTVGGFDQETISKIAEDIQKVFLHIDRSLVLNPTLKLTTQALEALLNDGKDTHWTVQVTLDETRSDRTGLLFAKGVDSSWNSFQPQITYQVPLGLIPKLFERFNNEVTIKNFLNSLIQTSKKFDIIPPIVPDILSENNNKMFKILNLFIEEISPRMASTSADLRGFCYLFLYYWVTLFNDNHIFGEPEPGLKQRLYLMSRIPFSQMFDSLQPHEKDTFQGIFKEIINQYGSSFKLREYYKDYPDPSNLSANLVQDGLTLKEWYQSIVDQSKRQ